MNCSEILDPLQECALQRTHHVSYSVLACLLRSDTEHKMRDAPFHIIQHKNSISHLTN